MELIAYLLVIMLNLNIFGAAVLFLTFFRMEISGVWNNVRRPDKRKKSTNREAN